MFVKNINSRLKLKIIFMEEESNKFSENIRNVEFYLKGKKWFT